MIPQTELPVISLKHCKKVFWKQSVMTKIDCIHSDGAAEGFSVEKLLMVTPVRNAGGYPGMEKYKIIRRNYWRIPWKAFTLEKMPEKNSDETARGFPGIKFWRIPRKEVWNPGEIFSGAPLENSSGVPLVVTPEDFSRSTFYGLLSVFLLGNFSRSSIWIFSWVFLLNWELLWEFLLQTFQ